MGGSSPELSAAEIRLLNHISIHSGVLSQRILARQMGNSTVHLMDHLRKDALSP